MGSKEGRSGCGRKGNGIDLAEELYKISFREACQKLGLDSQKVLDYRTSQKGGAAAHVMKTPVEEKSLSEISDAWRKNAQVLAKYASSQLKGEALDYLTGRGITHQSIRNHLLGFWPEYKWTDTQPWGASKGKMRLPRGIVIPWFNDAGEILCMRFRRLPSDESKQAREFYGVEKDGAINRYRSLLGSSTHYLYNGDTLFPGCDAALFEGELDAIIAEQACIQSPISIVATGSTSGARTGYAPRMLRRCDHVLVCFNADKAGEKAAKYWIDTLKNARRWRPLWGDANEMHKDGIDVANWLSLGLASTPAVNEDEVPGTPHGLYCACGTMVEYYGEDGTPYCGTHYPEFVVHYDTHDAATANRSECDEAETTATIGD